MARSPISIAALVGSGVISGGVVPPSINWPGSLSPQSYPAAVMAEPSLIAYWPLDDAATATAFADAKGGRSAVIQNKGTGVLLEQVSAMPGNAAKATKFVSASSGNGLLSVSDSTAFDFDGTSPFSIEAFVVPTVTRSGGTVVQALFAKQDATGKGTKLEIRWDGSAATRARFSIVNTNNTNAAVLQGMTTDFQNSQPYLITVTYDGSKNTNGMAIRTNGQQESVSGGNIANNLTGSTANTGQASVGSLNNTAQFNNSLMQGVAIFGDKQAPGPAHYRAGLAAGRQPLAVFTGRRKFILDTDDNTDVDDQAALAIAGYGHLAQLIEILAVVASSSNDYTAPCIEATLKHWGISPAIGAYKGSALPATSVFTQQVASRFGFTGKTRADYVDAVTTLRMVLASQADNSVEMAAIGALTNYSALRQSPADGISPLTGQQLIAAKVKRLWVMGSAFPDTTGLLAGNAESNMSKDPAAAKDVFDNWPTEILCHGYEVGYNVFCGPPADADPLTNPIKYSFDLYGGTGQLTNGERQAWDPLLILHAIVGDVAGFQTGGLRGTNTVNASTGVNVWSMTAGNTSYAFKRIANSVFRDNLNTILAAMK